MYNNNLSVAIIRIAFAKGSDQIHVGLTRNGNKTFVGEIVYSEELTISHYNKLLNVDGNNLVGSVGTICIADDEEANALISQIESIQAARQVNSRGNKYPFVFLRVITDGNEGEIIFNKGVGGAPHRLTFLDVECIEVEADAPDEVVQVETPQVVAPSRSSYGTVRYRPQVKVNTSASVKAARAGLEVSSNDVTPLVDPRILRSAPNSVRSSEGMKQRVAPSFNRNIVESVGEVEEQPLESLDSLDSLDSQQDKLNAIAVAMKAAGMSGVEIAQALKKELELVF